MSKAIAYLRGIIYPSKVAFFAINLFIAYSCKQNRSVAPDDQEEFVILDYPVNDLVRSDEFQRDLTKGGIIQSDRLNEASGLVVSRSNPGVIWSHNDSGHPNRLFAVGCWGEDLGTYSITGAGSRDYEDIAIGVGPVDGVEYLYVADIGDNDAKYNYVVVYRFPEPDISGLDSLANAAIPESGLERLEFTYPDGPKDAETLLLDPWTKDLYIISKREYRSTIYRAKYPQSATSRTMLEKVAQLPFNWAVGGDISSDGRQIAIKDRNRVYYWTRTPGQSVVDALRTPPQLLPYVLEPQGESFGWEHNGNGYFTLSERESGPRPPLYYYSKK